MESVGGSGGFDLSLGRKLQLEMGGMGVLNLRRRRELDLELRRRRSGFCLRRRGLEGRLGLGGRAQGVLPPAEGGRGQLVLDDV